MRNSNTIPVSFLVLFGVYCFLLDRTVARPKKIIQVDRETGLQDFGKNHKLGLELGSPQSTITQYVDTQPTRLLALTNTCYKQESKSQSFNWIRYHDVYELWRLAGVINDLVDGFSKPSSSRHVWHYWSKSYNWSISAKITLNAHSFVHLSLFVSVTVSWYYRIKSLCNNYIALAKLFGVFRRYVTIVWMCQ